MSFFTATRINKTGQAKNWIPDGWRWLSKNATNKFKKTELCPSVGKDLTKSGLRDICQFVVFDRSIIIKIGQDLTM